MASNFFSLILFLSLFISSMAARSQTPVKMDGLKFIKESCKKTPYVQTCIERLSIDRESKNAKSTDDLFMLSYKAINPLTDWTYEKADTVWFSYPMNSKDGDCASDYYGIAFASHNELEDLQTAVKARDLKQVEFLISRAQKDIADTEKKCKMVMLNAKFIKEDHALVVSYTRTLYELYGIMLSLIKQLGAKH